MEKLAAQPIEALSNNIFAAAMVLLLIVFVILITAFFRHISASDKRWAQALSDSDKRWAGVLSENTKELTKLSDNHTDAMREIARSQERSGDKIANEIKTALLFGRRRDDDGVRK